MGSAISQVLRGNGESGYGFHTSAEDITQGLDLSPTTAIVTGATSGIGLETAKALAMRGARVILAARNIKAAQSVKESILENKPDARIEILELDLSSLASVRRAAEDFHARNLPLHILINNAGALVPRFMRSEDGIELQFATNHLGHFLLTKLLLDKMVETSRDSRMEGRIVNVASQCYRIARDGIEFDKLNDPASFSTTYPLGYGISKLANILHAKELARRLKERGANVTANAVHPGVIHTNIVRIAPEYISYIISSIFSKQFEFSKSPSQGAATTCYVATHPGVSGVSGKYFVDCNKAECVSYANDMKLAQRLWQFSEKWTSPAGDGTD
ncbi:short-chain dehydrogenase TIC 32, chloroplastic [Selaginella moellendorffii]|uniref:short-chain dehydrogenase TIC 32, chloroplastic n=1 Tax=Selaginella moellendorffii TaxID=88036 RepID=UPI000D1C77EC|nr:short-chain dehydrogenase TIC 32, chloroplastic [Selaginella moellendorffii]|eukprot:XP_024538692.1 short-chain dehydrogenase TIC 32, chloroplastic [Selaginella moellendorffii]